MFIITLLLYFVIFFALYLGYGSYFFIIYHFYGDTIDEKRTKSMGDRDEVKRLQLRIYSERVARIADVSFSTYSNNENAIQSPSLDIYISIVLDISMDYLIFRNENIKRY